MPYNMNKEMDYKHWVLPSCFKVEKIVLHYQPCELNLGAQLTEEHNLGATLTVHTVFHLKK